MVASRCGLRAPIRFRAVSMRSFTSSGVRYSRGRRAALDTRGGGIFPFTALGMLPFLAREPLRLIGVAYPTFPFIAQNGKVAAGRIGRQAGGHRRRPATDARYPPFRRG